MSSTSVGLLLQAIPYLGKKKILKIFTPEQGLLSLFSQNTALSPFCLAEWVFRKSAKEIQPLQDVTLIDPLLSLRESYNVIAAAGAMAQDLLRTQWPEKRAPELFDLTLFYFKHLPLNPDLLAASFRLKLLLHEGLLSDDPDPAFTPAEWTQVHTLAFSRELSKIQSVQAAPHSKIRSLLE
ncbi:MAG: DNA repair protein RecO, partial [Verrucomicrobia bacterium]|nr:DNA repair protein RecO [Verrucomicrobiota bacterium]